MDEDLKLEPGDVVSINGDNRIVKEDYGAAVELEPVLSRPNITLRERKEYITHVYRKGNLVYGLINKLDYL